MTDAFYRRLSETARRLIANRGRQAVLRRRGEPQTGSVGEPWRPQLGEPYDIPITILEVEGVAKNASGTVIKEDEIEGIMSSEVEPLETDLIVDGGDVYQMVGIKRVKPGSRAVLFMFHAKK